MMYGLLKHGVVFPNDSTNSRIILTSRHHHITPCGYIANEEPHLLRPREVKECFDILQAKLFPEKNELGMKFAEKCKGLPLTAVIIAGLLATTEKIDWIRILDTLNSGGLSGEEQCNTALELSFNHLPDDLKLCFLYFGAFPEDEEVTVKRLIRLWMAEGFVRKHESKRIEDVAREYMDELIETSLVKVGKIRSIAGAKTCQIHEFCRTKAKQRNFFHLLQQSLDQLSDFNEPENLQRLSIHADVLHFQNSGIFCPAAHVLLFFSTGTSTGYVHSFFYMSSIIQVYKNLQVLDMGQIILDFDIPSEIEFLTRLKYLSIQSYLAVIPSSIGNLSNLETFITKFWSNEVASLPPSLWNLHKLKYLHIECRGRDEAFTLPDEYLENSQMLLELETLSTVCFCTDGSMERQMRKFPNIRKLSCCILPAGLKHNLVPDFLCQLQSLSIAGKGKLLCQFGFTENLRKVKLKGFELSREDITVIGGFPNLEVLKLVEIYYEGGILEMGDGEFSKLRYLKLHELRYRNLERWIAPELPNLQKLILVSCTRLKEIPSCLDSIPTLEEIELSSSSPTVESLVRAIEEAYEDYGNSIKVQIIR